MAKKGIPVEWRLYVRRDPVTGKEKMYHRRKHTYATSERLLAFRKCIREAMQGYEAPGATAKERAQNVRRKLAEVAKACAARV